MTIFAIATREAFLSEQTVFKYYRLAVQISRFTVQMLPFWCSNNPGLSVQVSPKYAINPQSGDSVVVQVENISYTGQISLIPTSNVNVPKERYDEESCTTINVLTSTSPTPNKNKTSYSYVLALLILTLVVGVILARDVLPSIDLGKGVSFATSPKSASLGYLRALLATGTHGHGMYHSQLSDWKLASVKKVVANPEVYHSVFIANSDGKLEALTVELDKVGFLKWSVFLLNYRTN